MLIDRILAGETAAWSQLYERCHRPLCAAIRGMLPMWPVDRNLVDELAARVWYAVVREDARLLARFNPGCNCRLTTYLALIAKDEASRLFRSERRRRRRECDTYDGDPSLIDHSAANAGEIQVSVGEFEKTLTPAEWALYQEIVSVPDAAETTDPHESNRVTTERSRANLWQLRHRLREKLLRHLAS